jgi:hypothetical protein
MSPPERRSELTPSDDMTHVDPPSAFSAEGTIISALSVEALGHARDIEELDRRLGDGPAVSVLPWPEQREALEELQRQHRPRLALLEPHTVPGAMGRVVATPGADRHGSGGQLRGSGQIRALIDGREGIPESIDGLRSPLYQLRACYGLGLEIVTVHNHGYALHATDPSATSAAAAAGAVRSARVHPVATMGDAADPQPQGPQPRP